jgi:hypothetical protein
MSVAEMKLEVIKKITGLDNESVLKDVLTLLKEVTDRGEGFINLSRNYDALKEQYGEVLQRLAQ